MAAMGTFESLLRSRFGFLARLSIAKTLKSAFMFCEKSWWKHINMLPWLGSRLNKYLNFILLQKRHSCLHKELICDWIKQSVKLGLSSAAFLSPRYPCLFVTCWVFFTFFKLLFSGWMNIILHFLLLRLKTVCFCFFWKKLDVVFILIVPWGTTDEN